MELRNKIMNLFKNTKHITNTVRYKLLNTFNISFGQYDNNIYNDLTCRTCIDAIARNTAKAKMRHIRRINGMMIKANTNLDYLLSTRPNNQMSSYDFLYNITTQLYLYNNAFIYIQTDDKGNIIGLWPLNYNNCDLVQLDNNNNNDNLYLKFSFMGNQQTIPYTDIIHLRRHFKDEFLGAGNNNVLYNTLQMLLTLKDGMINYVTNCVNLRGLIKINNSQMRPEDKQAALETFNSNINKKTGYGVLDKSMDFTQFTNDLKTVDNKQLEFVRQDIYRYFGVNENIINGKFTEADYNSFYESVIEPLIIQYQQEFTEKIFTAREKQVGNEIILETNRLEYCTLQSKVQMAQVLQQSGVMTVNELREVFGFAGVENGDALIIKADYTKIDTINNIENTEGEKTNE